MVVPPESSARKGRAWPKPIGDPVSWGVAGVSTTEVALVPTGAASAAAPVPEPVLASPPTAVPAEAWAPVSPVDDGAAVGLSATWDDRAEVPVEPEPEPEPETVGEATALLDAAEGVAGVPPVSPEVATGLLVEMAVASPVFPLLDAEEVAMAGPESPVVAVGLVTTLEPPPLPPPDVPVVTLLPPVAGAAMAGEAKNRTVAIVSAVATPERIDRRLVASAISRSSTVEQASNGQL